MNIEVKSGPYGKYLEWTNEENEVCRVALKEYSLRDLTEKQYEELIETKKLNFTTIHESNSRNYIDGYKIVDAKLKDYISKKDNKRHFIIETEEKIIKDSDKINSFLDTYEVTEKTIDEIVKNANRDLKTLDLAAKEFILVKECDSKIQIDDKTYMKEIYIVQEYETHNTIFGTVCYLITDKDDNIIKIFKDIELWRKYAEESRNYEAAIKRQKEIEEIMSQPWHEVSLQEVYEKFKGLVDGGWNCDDHLEELKTLIDENYKNKNLNKIIVWEVRAVDSWRNYSGRTNQSSGGTTYHVRNVLPGYREFIYGYYQNWTDVYLKEANLDYDRSVEYVLQVDARPTD